MEKREYELLKKRIQSEYDANMAALDRVWEIAKIAKTFEGPDVSDREGVAGGQPDKSEENGDDWSDWEEISEDNGLSKQPASVKDAILEIGNNWDSGFTWKDIQSEIIAKYQGISTNRTTLIQALRKLQEDGKIKVSMKGSGTRPTLYTFG